MNRLLLIAPKGLSLVYIMYALVGCTYEVSEDDMTTPRFAQQLSKRGLLNPGGGINSQVAFQLAHIVNQDTGYSEPGNYTLQFSVADTNVNLNSGDFVRARAEIIWSAGGNSVRRVVDCGNGVSASGTCDGVIVNIYDDSITTHGSTFVPYMVSVQLAKGSRASIQQPPTYSTDAATLTGNTAVNVDIPQNIGAISAFVTVAPALDVALGAYQVEVTQVSGNLFRLKRYDPRQSDWVPLTAGATQIRLASSPTAPDLLYQITFGIDG